MDKNKLIIIALIVIIILFAIGICATMFSHVKEDTKVLIRCNSTMHEGDTVYIKLIDLNKTPIENQTINVTLTDKDKTNSYYSVVTNVKGVAKLKLDKDVGNYTINCTYAGNENYTGNSSVKKFSIEEEVVEAQTSSSSYSSGDTSSYTYSPQHQSYIRDDGQWRTDSRGNNVYNYKGDDGAIYERYYDSNGNEINPNDYFR